MYISHGTAISDNRPGTDAARAHLPQLMSTGTSSAFAAATATGLPAIAVMNIAELIVLTMTMVIIRYEPSRLRETSSSGRESSSSDSERMIGNTTPPARAVLDGVAGARIRSVAAMP